MVIKGGNHSGTTFINFYINDLNKPIPYRNGDTRVINVITKRKGKECSFLQERNNSKILTKAIFPTHASDCVYQFRVSVESTCDFAKTVLSKWTTLSFLNKFIDHVQPFQHERIPNWNINDRVVFFLLPNSRCRFSYFSSIYLLFFAVYGHVLNGSLSNHYHNVDFHSDFQQLIYVFFCIICFNTIVQ